MSRTEKPKAEKPKSKGKTSKPTPSSASKPSPRRRGSSTLKYLKWSGVVIVWGFFLGLCLLGWLAYDLPSLDKLTTATRRPSITLVTGDGAILASYGDLYGKPVTLNELPPYVADAFLAKEDRRFYSHFGVDLYGVVRALWFDIKARRI